MNMLLVNDVYELFGQRYRILWRDQKTAYWIDIDADSALPQLIELSVLVERLADEVMRCIDDPFEPFILNPTKQSQWAQDIQSKAWEMVKQHVTNEPTIYERTPRGKMIQAMVQRHGTTKALIYRKLREYWQRGKSPNALYPDTSNKGSPNKAKTITDKKRGRPRKVALGTGVNITPEIEKVFRTVIKSHYQTEDENTVRYVYRRALFLLGFDSTKKNNEEQLAEAPTYEQFYYFLQKEISDTEKIKKRLGEIAYQKDYRPVLGSSTAGAMGPGSLYQIDATIGDVYLIDEETRSVIVGRPVIYIVIDVFSRMITGVHVGLEGPSWVSAMFALANTMFDKVRYCASYGITINHDEWPVVGKPEAILGDKGELIGTTVEVLSEALFINILNTPSFRADWKGIVEQQFRTLQTNFKPFVEGYVEGTTIKKRGGSDYRLDAELTLRDITRIIINCVIIYNTTHAMNYYDTDNDIPPDLPLIPLALWNWGIQNRTGKLRGVNEELAAVNLMPHKEASITEYGLYLFGCYYSAPIAIKEEWFVRIKGRSGKVLIAYDPHNADTIYFRPNGKYDKFIPFELTERSRAFRGRTFWDVWRMQAGQTKTHAKSKLTKLNGELARDKKIEEIVEEARSKNKDMSHLSKSQRTANIRENKKNEIDINRARNGVMPTKTRAETKPVKKDNVVYLSGEKPQDYSVPSMLDTIYGEDDGN
jgi:putative transposase